MKHDRTLVRIETYPCCNIERLNLNKGLCQSLSWFPTDFDTNFSRLRLILRWLPVLMIPDDDPEF